MEWIKNIVPHTAGHQSIMDFDAVVNAMAKYFLSIKVPFFMTEIRGETKLKYSEVLKLIKDKVSTLGTLEYTFVRRHPDWKGDSLIGKNFAISVEWSPKNRIEINTFGTNENNINDFNKEFKELLKGQRPDQIYAIIKNESGLDFTSIGEVGIPLERENYDESVLKTFDHVITDLKSVNPCGQLVIINGAPGGGKTFLTRSIIHGVDSAQFVIIPPGLVGSLGDPELLTTFINIQERKSNSKKHTLVLIVEDADSCLVPRASDNMSSITSLLNIGDGILGRSLDLRVIATTNAKSVEIDRALMRNGRLCARIQIDALNKQQSAKIFKRLTGKDKEYAKDTILADIYKDSRII